jgi:hypothetical protein
VFPNLSQMAIWNVLRTARANSCSLAAAGRLLLPGSAYAVQASSQRSVCSEAARHSTLYVTDTDGHVAAHIPVMLGLLGYMQRAFTSTQQCVGPFGCRPDTTPGGGILPH